MKRKNKGTAVLAIMMVVSLSGASVVYAEESGELHELIEYKIVPPTCTEKGYTVYRCKEDDCNYEEKRDETEALGHDLTELLMQEVTDEKPGIVIIRCQREGCDYMELVEVPVKDPNTSDDKSEDKVTESDTKPDEKPDTDTEQKTEKKDNLPEGDDSDDEKTDEELPDEDIDEEDVAYASATSTDIVTEYDPETAAGTLQVTKKNAGNEEETEEVAGMTVPPGTTEIKQDSDGNITDLVLSMEIEEVKNGFSLISENKKLHSIAMIDPKDPKVHWITLSAKKAASELGIRLHAKDDKTIITLTENEKVLNIVKISETEKEVILTTSTAGTCVINKNSWKLSVGKNENFSEKKIQDRKNQIILNDVNGSRPYLELTYAKTEDKIVSEKGKTSADSEKKNSDEELYWIQPYGDEKQEPIVITVYKK